MAVASPAASIVHVPAQRDGVLLVVGTEIKEAEKVPADRHRRRQERRPGETLQQLREGDVVEEGQLLARLDDRLARLDVEVPGQDRRRGGRAEYGGEGAGGGGQAGAEPEQAQQHGRRCPRKNSVRPSWTSARAEGDEQVKAAGLQEAKTRLKAVEAVLEMYEIRSPVRGVVKAVEQGPRRGGQGPGNRGGD